LWLIRSKTPAPSGHYRRDRGGQKSWPEISSVDSVQDILRHRVEAINLAFRSSIAEFGYQGKYRGVFPIKVNQLREVVEEILDAGKPFDLGLEVGSKPELFAGLALQNQMGQPHNL
jgi:arginine decarboxylase-like protein